MAGLYYTFAQLKAAAAHVLGGNPDSRISKGLIVNRAINHLQNAHQWRWREVTTTINFVASEGDIVLPSDFGEMIELLGNAAKYTALKQVTPHELLILRVHGVMDSLFLGWLTAIGAQVSPTAPPAYVLRVAPIPATSITDALYIHYRKVITGFTTDDNDTADDAKVPAIPVPQHDTLYQLVRAFASAMEEDPQNAEWQLAGQFLARDIDADSRTTSPNLGPMRGGLVEDWYGHSQIFRPFNEIRTAYDP